MTDAITVRHLTIYPIKSTAAVDVETAAVNESGLAGDREFVIVDDKGQFRHQREDPTLALIRATREHDTLRLEAPGQAPLHGPIPTLDGSTTTAKVWRREKPSVWFAEPFHQWLTKFLGKPAKLARCVPQPVSANAIPGFFDTGPILVVATASLQDLNSRLRNPIDRHRFRSNLVLATHEPYEEEHWERISVGSAQLQSVKTCARCVMITVDPNTGKMSDPEPLKVLSTYRKQGSHVLFGQYFRVVAQGSINVGDHVQLNGSER